MKDLKLLLTLVLISVSLSSCAQSNNNIVGVWNVKNNYYEAIYEIVEHKNKFFGKVHYYNDGATEYKGDNKKEDYFLTDIEAKDGKFINGKMYLPDGRFYKVIFSLKDKNTLEALMTIENEPYREIWTRDTNY